MLLPWRVEVSSLGLQQRLGPRQVQLMSAANRCVDLEKEDEKTQAEEGPGAGQGQGCASPGLGCSPSSPGRSYSFSFLSLGLYRAHASGRNPRSVAQYRMRIAKRTGHSGQRLQALCPSPTCLVFAGCSEKLQDASRSYWQLSLCLGGYMAAEPSGQFSVRAVLFSPSSLPPVLLAVWVI